MTLSQIQEELETTEVTPSRAADLGVLVAAKYSRAADEYVNANAAYANAFTIIRNSGEFKSDTSCERWLDNQEVGLTLHRWKYQLKKAEMIQKALSNLVYVKTAEARNMI